MNNLIQASISFSDDKYRSNKRTEKDRDVDQSNPWLIIHIHFLESHSPRMFNDHPSEQVDDDCN